MTLTLYRSGLIHAPGIPRATALLVDSDAGEIVWVGTDEAAAGLGDPDIEVGLEERLMVPAFVDAWALDGTPTTLRTAVSRGVGAVHVLHAPDDGERAPAAATGPSPGAQVSWYEPVEGDSL